MKTVKFTKGILSLLMALMLAVSFATVSVAALTDTDKTVSSEVTGAYADNTYYEVSVDEAAEFEKTLQSGGVEPKINIDITEADLDKMSSRFASQSKYYGAATTKEEYKTTYGYDHLSAKLKKAYDVLAEKAYSYDNSSTTAQAWTDTDGSIVGYTAFTIRFTDVITTGESYTKAEVSQVYWYFRHDNPQIYWLDNTWGSGSNVLIVCTNITSGTERIKRKEKLYDKVDTLVATYSGRNDYSAEYDMFKYSCDNNYYTEAAHAHDATGMLIDGKSVCEGISKAMQIYLNACDIDNIYVVGYMTSRGPVEGGHAWNQVCLDEEWYNIDATWADQVESISWNWFNVTTANFTNHTVDNATSSPPLYPVISSCTATKYSYANHSQNYIGDYVVTFSQPANGTISVKKGTATIQSGDSIKKGDVLTVTATPAQDYYLTSLTANNVSILSTMKVTATGSVVIEARFSKPVAKVGNLVYESLQDAFNAVTSANDTVYLINNVTYDDETLPTRAFTLSSLDDDAPKTFSVTGDMTLSGNVTFDNVNISNTSGTIVVPSAKQLTVNSDATGNLGEISGDGTVTINGADISSGTDSRSDLLVLKNGAKLTCTEFSADRLKMSDSSSIICSGNLMLGGITGITAGDSINLSGSSSVLVLDGNVTGNAVNVNFTGKSLGSNAINVKDSVTTFDTTVFNVTYGTSKTEAMLSLTGNSGGYDRYSLSEAVWEVVSSAAPTKKYKFGSWADAVAKINALNSTTATYTVTMLKNDGEVASVVPTKAKALVFANGTHENIPVITVKNITASCPISFNRFGRVDIGPVDMNNKDLTLVSYGNFKDSVLNINQLTITTIDASNTVSAKTVNFSDEFALFKDSSALITNTLNNTGSGELSFDIDDVQNIPTVTINTAVNGNAVVVSGSGIPVGTTLINAPSSSVTADKFISDITDGEGKYLGFIKSGSEIKTASASIFVYKDNSLVGSYITWADMLKGFNSFGSTESDFTISLDEDTDATTLPTKAKSIEIKSSADNVVKTLTFNATSVTQNVPMTLRNVEIFGTNGSNINWNMGNKSLNVKNVTLIGNVTGSLPGLLSTDGRNNHINGKLSVGRIEMFEESELVAHGGATITQLRMNSNATNETKLFLDNGSTNKIGNIEADDDGGSIIWLLTDENGENTAKLSITDNIVLNSYNSAGAIEYPFSIGILKPVNGGPSEALPVANGTTIFTAGSNLVKQAVSVKKVTLFNKSNGDTGEALELYDDNGTIKASVPTIKVYDVNETFVDSFVTLNSAVDYINNGSTNSNQRYTISLTEDIDTKCALPSSADNRFIVVNTDASITGRKCTLKFTGGINISAGGFGFENIILDNGLSSGINVVANGGVNFYTGCEANINTVSGTGSISLQKDDYTVGGAVSGNTLMLLNDATVTFKKPVTVRQLNIRSDNTVNITGTNAFTIANTFDNLSGDALKVNRVDSNGNLLQLADGATLVTVKDIDVSANNFITDNTMPNSTEKFLIKRNGTNVVVGSLVAKVGDEKFASFNAANEYVDAQTTGTYTIELFADDKSADLSELSAKVTEITSNNSAPVVLTTSKDVYLSSNLMLSNTKLVASGKTIYARIHALTLSDGAEVTANKATGITVLTVDGSKIALSAHSTANKVSLKNGGSIKCPKVEAYSAT